jgi:dihydrodipicolinate synthase/N-acetylneuraminate lyase
VKQIISAAVTPFTDDDKLDLESATRLFEFGLGHKLDGFFVMGSMGEWALLTTEERDTLAKLACDVIGNKAKILLGISDTGLPAILRNVERWSHLSHSHWTVVLPGSWAGPGNPVTYLHDLADRVDRPLYFYYLPQFNGVTITMAQFRDIFAHPNIAGIKNSSSNIRVRKELLMLKRDMEFELYDGEEWGLDEALLLGCDGAVAGFSSTGAKLMKRIAACVEANDFASAARLQWQLIEMFYAVYGDMVTWPNAGQKYALHYMGLLASARCRVAAQQNLPASHLARIRACIDANRQDIF